MPKLFMSSFNSSQKKNFILLAKPVIAACLVISVTACTKGRFPKQNFLIGTWVEESTADFHHKLVFDERTLIIFKKTSTDTFNADFHHKLVFDERTLIIFKKTSTDTFNYDLDRKEKRMVLTPITDSASAHGSIGIERASFEKKITVYGLFFTTGNESVTVFRKE